MRLAHLDVQNLTFFNVFGAKLLRNNGFAYFAVKNLAFSTFLAPICPLQHVPAPFASTSRAPLPACCQHVSGPFASTSLACLLLEFCIKNVEKRMVLDVHKQKANIETHPVSDIKLKCCSTGAARVAQFCIRNRMRFNIFAPKLVRRRSNNILPYTAAATPVGGERTPSVSQI